MEDLVFQQVQIMMQRYRSEGSPAQRLRLLSDIRGLLHLLEQNVVMGREALELAETL
jgi:hypothetical protein